MCEVELNGLGKTPLPSIRNSSYEWTKLSCTIREDFDQKKVKKSSTNIIQFSSPPLPSPSLPSPLLSSFLFKNLAEN